MDMELIKRLEAEYTIRDGIISNPGKFEGETLLTPYLYDCYLNGFGTTMELEPDELAYFELEPDKKYVYLAESNDGFVSVELYATEAEAEARDIEDSTEEDMDDQDDQDDQEPAYCPMCGTNNYPIGTLGILSHYNCRACGMWYTA